MRRVAVALSMVVKRHTPAARARVPDQAPPFGESQSNTTAELPVARSRPMVEPSS
jgi:hypothetical protein